MVARIAVVLLVAALVSGCADDGGSGTPGTATSTATVVATATLPSSATRTTSPTASPTLPPPATNTATFTSTASATATITQTSTPTASATVARTPAACAALAGVEIAGAHILDATMVAATSENPELCRVNGRIEPKLNFQLHLPVNWNGKAVFLGGGGFDGVLPMLTGGSPGTLSNGYLLIGTDSGHTGTPFDASWALDDTAAFDDFADQAWHRVLLAAREIALLHYAAPIQRAYFEGGSSGGREALIQAQRWPEDYDGVIARAPALNFTALMLAANRNTQRLFAAPDRLLPAAALHTYSRAVLAACDALDGLEDSVVANVAACHFDAASLLCSGGATTDCLTQAQIGTIDALHATTDLGVTLANGVTQYPGYALSGEEDEGSSWRLWLTGFSSSAPSSLLFLLQDQFIKYFVTKDAEFASLEFDPAAHADTLAALSDRLDATDADLSSFVARGGKVILWHGWADPAISPYGTVDYYQRLVAAAGGQAAADTFARLYLAPGVDHNGTGNGAPIVDLITPLDAWVEQNSAPGDLVASKRSGGDAVPFRPLCRYPTYPRYRGSGDPNAPESFECAGAGFSLETTRLCALVDARDAADAAFPPTPPVRVFGTDLGWTYERDGVVTVLFGDSWQRIDICPLQVNDDTLATMNIPGEDWPGYSATASLPESECPELTYPVNPAGTAFAPLELRRNGVIIPLGPLNTPVTGFFDGEREWAVFIVGGGQTCSAHDAANGAPCPTTLSPQAADLICGPVGTQSLCVDPTSSRSGAGAQAFYLHIAERVGPTSYVSRAMFLTNKYLNLTARTVRAFDPDDSAGRDYRPGTGALLVWGRPGFDELVGEGEEPPYFLYHSLPLTVSGDRIDFAPHYLSGVTDGKPQFSDHQRDAVPLYTGELEPVNHHAVSYIEPLGRWLTIYSGSTVDYVNVAGASGQSQPMRGAFYARFAPDPWGPWSETPSVALAPEVVAEDFVCGKLAPVGCIPPPSPLIRPGCLELVDPLGGGALYGANIVDAMTRASEARNGAGPAADIFWNLSTWHPYSVVLVKTHLEAE